MSLTDIVSAAGLAIYAQVALIIFVAVFIAIVIRTFAPSRGRYMDEAARIPLEEDASFPASRGRKVQ